MPNIRVKFDRIVLKPLWLIFIILALYYFFQTEIIMGLLMIGLGFSMGIVGAGLHPERSAKELSEGFGENKEEHLSEQETSLLLGRAVIKTVLIVVIAAIILAVHHAGDSEKEKPPTQVKTYTQEVKSLKIGSKVKDFKFTNNDQAIMVKFYSTAIDNISWGLPEKKLMVKFKDRNNYAYMYLDVPIKTIQGLLLAPSTGRFFHENIKDKYEFRKISMRVLTDHTRKDYPKIPSTQSKEAIHEKSPDWIALAEEQLRQEDQFKQILTSFKLGGRVREYKIDFNNCRIDVYFESTLLDKVTWGADNECLMITFTKAPDYYYFYDGINANVIQEMLLSSNVDVFFKKNIWCNKYKLERFVETHHSGTSYLKKIE